MAQTYHPSRKQTLRVKIESTAGTYETLTSAESVPIEDADIALNPRTRDANEARGTRAAGEVTVGGFQPRLTGRAKLRGSGAVATAPLTAPFLRAAGTAETTATVVPSSSTGDATAGTTTSFTIDRSVDTDWPSADDALDGRWALLSTNPATDRVVPITDYQVTGNDCVHTLGETMAAALDNTTDAQILPCMLYAFSDAAIPTISAELNRDGRATRIKGARGNLSFTFPGGGEPATVDLDFGGQFHAEVDDTLAEGDFSGLPAIPSWRNGRMLLNRVAVACSSFTMTMGQTPTQYPNPNDEAGTEGFDIAEVVAADVRGEMRINMADVATQARVSLLSAGTIVPICALMEEDLGAGARVGLIIPQAKLLDRSSGDREGIAEDVLPFQVIDGVFYLAMCL